MAARVINFGAGPAKLPQEVLETAQKEMLDWHGCGMSVMELSHRGKEFKTIISEAERDLRTLMNIPATHEVLFVQGGGSSQFSVVPLNLAAEESTVDYIVTGAWSAKAAAEAKRFVKHVNIVNGDAAGNTDLGKPIEVSPASSYLYYCANETIHGVELSVPDVPSTTVLVADMSSNILSRKVDVTKFGLIFAGAQKNIGCSGVTIVIVRKDLLGAAQRGCPEMMNLRVHADNGSLYNTPPTWSIYIAGLVFKWMIAQGGTEEFERRSASKSSAVYDVIDASQGFYSSPVAAQHRSRMNVPFRIKGGDAALENKFLKLAESRGMQQLAGHRAVGGIRASLYNAISLEETQALVGLLREFHAAHQ